MIGLLFGSFDPIHNGHLSIAHWALSAGGCQEVWIVLSPQNPMKLRAAAPYIHRKTMVELALQGEKNVKLCTVEENLTPPFYTINTIEKLQNAHPHEKFVILCGTDVKQSSHKWHRAEELHRMVEFVEYPRYENNEKLFVDVSSTEVRQGLKCEFVNNDVWKYVEENGIYDPHVERGRALYNQGDITGAINAWGECKECSPKYGEAQALIELASDIMAYRYSDIYNP